MFAIIGGKRKRSDTFYFIVILSYALCAPLLLLDLIHCGELNLENHTERYVVASSIRMTSSKTEETNENLTTEATTDDYSTSTVDTNTNNNNKYKALYSLTDNPNSYANKNEKNNTNQGPSKVSTTTTPAPTSITTNLSSITTTVSTTTLRPISNPGEFTNFMSTKVTLKSVTVTWEEPQESNGSLDGYVVSIFEKDSNKVLQNSTTNNLKHTFLNLTPYTDYTIELYAFNIDENNLTLNGNPSTFNFTTDVDSPGKYGHLMSTEVTSESVTVTWEKPQETNGPIDGYVVSIFEKDSNKVLQTNTTNNLNHTFFNLTPYTNYTIELYAFNIDKNNVTLPGDTSRLIPRTLVAYPGECTNFMLTEVTSKSVTVTWEEPQETNGPIDGYVVSIFEKDSIEVLQYSATTNLNHTFVNLTSYTDYTVELYAFNIDENNLTLNGNPSTFNFTTDVDSPGKCVNLMSTEVTSESVTVTWEEPQETNGPIDGYVVSIFEKDSIEVHQNSTTNNLNHTFVNLTSYTDYTVELYAFNIDENNLTLNGNPSTFNFTTDVDNPGECGKFTSTKVTSESVTVTWEKPQETNGPIDGYVVSIFEKDSNKVLQTNTTNNLKHTFMKLTPYTDYTIELYAFNIDDNNLTLNGSSSKFNFTTLVDMPSPVRDVNITSKGSSWFYVEWAEPKDANGPLDGFEITLTNQNAITTLNSTDWALFFNITDLNAYTEYTIAIRAFNLLNSSEELWGEFQSLNETTFSAKPESCQELLIEEIGSHNATVSWIRPNITNGPIDGYLLQWWSLDNRLDIFQATIVDNSTIVTYNKVSRLKPFTTYNVSVVAYNFDQYDNKMFGDSIANDFQTGVFEPSECRNLAIKLLGSENVSISWQIPQVKNGPINGYIIEIVGPNETTYETSKTEYVITDLEPYTDYVIFVSAYNDDNSTRWKGPRTEVKIKTAVAAPSQVEDVEIASRTSTSMNVTWNRPLKDKGPIDGFIIALYMNDTELNVTDTNQTSINLVKLSPFTLYRVEVQAYNIDNSDFETKGDLLRSDPVPISKRTLTDVPGECLSFNATGVESRALTMTWEEPFIKNGPINGYVLKWRQFESNSTWAVKELNLTSVTSYKVTDLEPFTDYEMTISAFNLAQDELTGVQLNDQKLEGPWFEYIVEKTDVSAPSEPSNLTMTFDHKTKNISVKWNEPEVTYGPINGYRVIWYQTEAKPGGPNSLNPVMTTVYQTKYEFPAMHWRTYSFLLKAFNFDRNSVQILGNLTSRTFETPIGKPNKPSNVRVSTLSDSSINVTWNTPLPLTGPTWYVIRLTEYAGNADANCDLKRLASLNPSVHEIPVLLWNTTHKVIDNLQPFKCYSVVVTAMVGDHGNLKTESTNLAATQTKDGIPPFPSSQMKMLSRNQTSVEFFITRNILSNSNGSAWNFAVRIEIGPDPNSNNFYPQRGFIEEDEQIASWQMVQTNTSIREYQASPLQWRPDTSTSETPEPIFGCTTAILEATHGLKCVLGAQEDCTGVTYCNGRLKPGTTYGIYVRKYTHAGFADSRNLIVTTESQDTDGGSSNAGLTAAVVIVTLLLVATGVGFVAFRKGYLPIKQCPILKFDHGTDIGQVSGVPLSQVGESRNRPIRVTNFKNDFKLHMANTCLGYANEFEQLKRLSPNHPKDVGQLPVNKSKNRYINIIPFDHTRVKLLPVEEDESSDYINASFIPGANWTKEYIACQGPLPNTVNDFWRMVWENQIQVIVMLTQCVERARNKCEEYWPKDNRGQKYGDLTIKLDHSSKLTHYTIRQFSIILNRKRLRVSQMQYTRWPCMVNPENPDDLINFARAVRDQPNVSPQHSPLLVHGSAGVGRTGTFITVDRLMNELQEKRSEWIDVLGTVLDLRNSRTSMVQTEDQYIYIHQCINRIIEELANKPTSPQYDDGEAIYANA